MTNFYHKIFVAVLIGLSLLSCDHRELIPNDNTDDQLPDNTPRRLTVKTVSYVSDDGVEFQVRDSSVVAEYDDMYRPVVRLYYMDGDVAEAVYYLFDEDRYVDVYEFPRVSIYRYDKNGVQQSSSSFLNGDLYYSSEYEYQDGNMVYNHIVNGDNTSDYWYEYQDGHIVRRRYVYENTYQETIYRYDGDDLIFEENFYEGANYSYRSCILYEFGGNGESYPYMTEYSSSHNYGSNYDFASSRKIEYFRDLKSRSETVVDYSTVEMPSYYIRDIEEFKNLEYRMVSESINYYSDSKFTDRVKTEVNLKYHGIDGITSDKYVVTFERIATSNGYRTCYYNIDYSDGHAYIAQRIDYVDEDDTVTNTSTYYDQDGSVSYAVRTEYYYICY